jgi:hypothetical protein
MQREIFHLAGIPVLDAPPEMYIPLIDDIETVACRAEIGARAASDALKRCRFPEWVIEIGYEPVVYFSSIEPWFKLTLQFLDI